MQKVRIKYWYGLFKNRKLSKSDYFYQSAFYFPLYLNYFFSKNFVGSPSCPQLIMKSKARIYFLYVFLFSFQFILETVQNKPCYFDSATVAEQRAFFVPYIIRACLVKQGMNSNFLRVHFKNKQKVACQQEQNNECLLIQFFKTWLVS